MSLIQWKRAANARQYGRHTSTCTWSCAEIQGDDSKCTGAWPLSSQKFSDARIFAFKIGDHPLVETLWGRHGNQWEYSTIWPDKTAVIWRASNSWQQFDHRCLILGPHSSADCLRPTTPLFSHTSKPIHTFAQQFNKQRVSYLSHELDKKWFSTEFSKDSVTGMNIFLSKEMWLFCQLVFPLFQIAATRQTGKASTFRAVARWPKWTYTCVTRPHSFQHSIRLCKTFWNKVKLNPITTCLPSGNASNVQMISTFSTDKSDKSADEMFYAIRTVALLPTVANFT